MFQNARYHKINTPDKFTIYLYQKCINFQYLCIRHNRNTHTHIKKDEELLFVWRMDGGMYVNIVNPWPNWQFSHKHRAQVQTEKKRTVRDDPSEKRCFFSTNFIAFRFLCALCQCWRFQCFEMVWGFAGFDMQTILLFRKVIAKSLKSHYCSNNFHLLIVLCLDRGKCRNFLWCFRRW